MSNLAWFGPTNALVMHSSSPKLSYGDRVRATDVYHGPQALCAASMLPRGTFGTGFRVGWVVNQSTCETIGRTIGKLTIEWEAGGALSTQPLPVGNFNLEPQELYPKIERNPFFNALSFDIVNYCYGALYTAPKENGDQIFNKAAFTAKFPDPSQLDLGLKLMDKLCHGEETFYLAGWRYTYETFYLSMPTLSPGGKIGAPGDPLAGHLPANVSWLQLADAFEPTGAPGSIYKATSHWLGGPLNNGIGYWDPDLYP